MFHVQHCVTSPWEYVSNTTLSGNGIIIIRLIKDLEGGRETLSLSWFANSVILFKREGSKFVIVKLHGPLYDFSVDCQFIANFPPKFTNLNCNSAVAAVRSILMRLSPLSQGNKILTLAGPDDNEDIN